MKKLTFFLLLFILFLSCGVLLDTNRIIGEWKLSKTEFYSSIPIIDSRYIIYGINDNSPDKNSPINAAFFDIPFFTNKNKHRIYADFQDNNNLRIYYTDVSADSTITVDIVEAIKGEWIVNNFENSLTIKIKRTSRETDNFWTKGGFKIVNYWPMSNYTTLELTITAQDVGKSHFSIQLEDKKVKVDTMKAIFIKE